MITKVVIMDPPLKDDGSFKNSSARNTLQEQINHNTVMFNTVVRDNGKVLHPASNLIDCSGRRALYKKYEADRDRAKLAKKNYEAMSYDERLSDKFGVLRALVNAKPPKWELKITLLKNK